MITERNEKHDFECEVPRCGWASREWPTVEMAEARAAQHAEEHETGIAMMSLLEFEQSQGYERPEGSVLIDAPLPIEFVENGEAGDGDHGN